MIDQSVIEKRLQKLREYIVILRSLQKFDYKRFAEDPVIHGSAERYLQLAIQCVLDIGNHIISDRGYKAAEDYEDILAVLGRETIVPQDFVSKIRGMAGFRNILVHEYIDVDLKEVYENLQSHLDDFEQFINYIKKLL